MELKKKPYSLSAPMDILATEQQALNYPELKIIFLFYQVKQRPTTNLRASSSEKTFVNEVG